MLEGYITPLLMSYIDKYVKNIKPSDLKLSFWGGDAVLRNLELRLDVLEKELRYPLKIKSGRIRELTLHIPWNAIASQPVEVTIKDLEFVVKLKDVRLHSTQNVPSQQTEADATSPMAAQPSTDEQQPSEQAPGYLKGYMTRISDNVVIHVQNMVVKVIEEECDMMLSLNIGTVESYTTDENWEKKFIYTDYFQGDYALYNMIEVADLVVNLHQIESLHEGESSKEPFVQRCSFTCRTKSDHQGGVLVKKTMNVFFESIEFCVDERQFCLYLHHLEWLLAMYYTSKRLQGQDDQQGPSDTQFEVTPGAPLQVASSTDAAPHVEHTMTTSTSQGNGGEQSGHPTGATTPLQDQQQGWGTWISSFWGDPEAKGIQQGASLRDTTATCDDKSGRSLDSTYAIFAKSVSVTLKVTHQMQVPMFYSVRSFTKPVLNINFTGCMAQMDVVSSTKLFLVSVGIMSIDASVTGVCPCAKKFPASWRASVASATEQVPVFSLGEEEACDPQVMLQGSLFDTPSTESLSKTSSEVNLSRPASPSEDFKAVWFSYEYYNASLSRPIEECTEVLNVGRVRAALSPDVIHRLQHFYETFKLSQEANPRFSEGMVRIGDPKAETTFRIRLVGGETVLSPNVHYLPVVRSDHRHKKLQRQSSSKLKPPKLPGLLATISECSVHITQPMYSGNASKETSQRTQLIANIREIQIGTVSFRTLEGSLKGSSMETFLCVPSLEINKHSKTYGVGGNNTAYLQLDVEEMSSTFSIAHISKLLFISGSWQSDPATSSVKFTPPVLHPTLGHLYLSVKNATVTKSISEHFSLFSAILLECSGAIVDDRSSSSKLCHVFPFLQGPCDTQMLNKVHSYKQLGEEKQNLFSTHERLVEFFIAIPHEDYEDEYFPAVQAIVSGFAVCLSPSLLAYVRHLPLEAYSVPKQQSTTCEPAKSEIPAGDVERPSSDISIATPTDPHSPSASRVVTSHKDAPGKENGFVRLLKLYATKVKMSPILVVMPTEEFDAAPVTSASILDHQLDLPILPALVASVSDPHSPALKAVLLSLPYVSLESAKSHVLDEPVPREGSRDTLPWDCTLNQLSLFTVANHKAYYIIEPTAIKATLAAQQEGVGITVHTETVALALSQKQASLLSHVVSTITDNLLLLCCSTSGIEEMENGDSGIASRTLQTPIHAPSRLSSPAYSTVTPTTLPASSESTSTSLIIYPGFSSLWVQVLVSKLLFSLYLKEPKEPGSKPEPSSSSSSNYTTPMTSPALVGDTHGKSSMESANLHDDFITKLSMEVDSASLQVDIQEKCMDVVFKVTAAEGSYLKKKKEGVWEAYLSSEKIFSSKHSAIPHDLSQVIAEFVPATSMHMSASPHQQSPTKPHRNFFFLDIKIPQDQPHKSPKIRLNVLPFEIVAWLPLVHHLQLFVAAAKQVKPPAQAKPQPKTGPTDVAFWPAVEVSLECFHVVLPSQDYSTTLLLSVGALQATSSLDYAGPDVRFVLNNSVYHRLSLLSSERKQPPLPAYQLDAFSISLWGLMRDSDAGSSRALLYASSADLRVVYTPPLYWVPFIGSATSPMCRSKNASLACGHCVEANLTTDVNLLLGTEQICCVSDVLADNVLTKGKLRDREPQSNSEVPAPSTESSVPFKLLLTGGVMAISLLTDNITAGDSTVEFAIDQSDSSFHPVLQLDGSVTPLLQVSLYNPLCSIQSSGSIVKCEVSCFNAGICYTNSPIPVSYADLLDNQVLSSLLTNHLLETRNGQPQGKNDLPSGFLTVHWSSMRKEGHPGAVPALSVDFGRPAKLSFTPALIQEAVNVLQCMSKVYRPYNDRDKKESDSSDVDTARQTISPWGTKTPSLEMQFTTTQVLVELQLIATQATDFSPPVLLELDSSLQGEGSAPSTTREGLLVAWDNLTATYPHEESIQGCTQLTGDLHVSGLQVLAIMDGHSSPVILPMQFNCLLSQHLPCSTLDLPQVAVRLSCGLLQFKVSQSTMRLASKAVKLVSDILPSLDDGRDEQELTRKATGPSPENTTVQFSDDLRTGEFKYNTENIDRPATPEPGEIVFHLGNEVTMPTMTWHYQEPRAVTKFKVLPVPFSITTEEDVPVDIKVVCSLECWSEESASYVSLKSFHVSESVPTEMMLPPEEQVPSRKWRVCVNGVEWVDDEQGELFTIKANVLDNSGSPVPLSSILSPLSLAASTQVDSYFNPSFIPAYTMNVHCQDIQATLLNSTSANYISGHHFRGYPVVPSPYDVAPQELLRMNISSFTGHLKQMRNDSMSLKLDGQVSLDFVDFRDLTWRTTIHPTNLNASIETKKAKEVAHWSASSDSSSESVVRLKCSPAVVRVSQGLIHTTALAVHVWSSGVDGCSADQETSSLTILSHYILCNDTLEDLHIGQVSTDEDFLLPSNKCTGYCWRSHKMSSPQALHTCLVTDGTWRWTKPFSISTTGVQAVQLFIGRHTATLYVHVTDLGGLQKQVTFYGGWKLCTSLPFNLEARLVYAQHTNQPLVQKQEFDEHQLPQLSLTPGSSVPSIVAADTELAGIQVRIPSGKSGWSNVYPLTSTAAHGWNKPQLLAEMSTSSGQALHCWYNSRPMDTTDGQPWGNKITFAPLFAVCNHLPFDLTLNTLSMHADGCRNSLPSSTVPGRGVNLPLTDLSADVWYHLKFQKSELEAVSEPAVALSTYLLLQLPFSPHQSTGRKWPYDTPQEESQALQPDATAVATVACKLTLPLEGRFYCSVNATILRSTLNTITVHLKPETLVVNKCPLTVRLVETLDEEEVEESRERNIDLSSMDVSILVNRQFTLSLLSEDQQLFSEPVVLPAMKGERSKEKDHPTSLSVMLCTDKLSSKQLIGELLVSLNWCDDGMLVAVVKSSYIVHNNTPHQLSLRPYVMMKGTSDVTTTCLQQIASGETKEVVFWHQESLPSNGTAHALSFSASEQEMEEKEWSIFIPLSYVRRSFALPTCNPQDPYSPCLLTTHEHEDVTYIVVAHDPSPRLQIQNLCAVKLEVVGSEAKGVDAAPQPILPGHQVTYELPTLAKLYPAVYDEDITTNFEKQLLKASKQASLNIRVCSTNEEEANEKSANIWSSPLSLVSDEDQVIDIPGMGSTLVSTYRQGNTQFLSLLPTGMVSSFQPMGKGATASPSPRKALHFDGTLAELVVCLDDEVSDPSTVSEVFRMITNDTELYYSTSANDGTSIDLAVGSLRVDNMAESSLGEFAVTLLPRAEHAATAELIKSEPLPLMKFSVHYNPHMAKHIDTFQVSFQPITVQIEDSLLHKCRGLLESYGIPGVLKAEVLNFVTVTEQLGLPPTVLQEAERDVSPLSISSLVIEPTAVYLKAKISLKVMLSCSDSPFRFSRYKLKDVYSNMSEVSQTIVAHYISSIFMHMGWLLGSLEIIGSPGTFIQSVGTGLRDLVTLPYEGLTRSPSLFILGIGQGAASFVRQFSSGALGSVTKFASSMSRNMERLSMDPNHMSYQDQQRRERPATHFTSGLATGVSSFSLSLVSAVAGVVEQPMQSVHQMEASSSALGATRSLLAGVGKGLIGAVAKPVGGAMELVSQTGQGLLHGTGLSQQLVHKALELECYTGPVHRANLTTTATRCAGKLEAAEHLLTTIPVTHISSNGANNTAILLITPSRVHLLDCESDSLQRNFAIGECNLVEKRSTQVDEVELHLVHQSSQNHSQKESPKFQPVAYYLQLSQSHELIMSPQIETIENRPEEEAKDPSMVLRVKTHQAAQLLSVFHAVRQCIVDSKSAFCVHTFHAYLEPDSSFYSCK